MPLKNDCHIVDKEKMIPGPVGGGGEKKEVSWKEQTGLGMAVSVV